ncbi:type II toxin-antitoxin system RelE/ParE family toxin [Acidithiobacillus sp. IBUN Pt1247-S3]|uniref:type II toxin-antitoxin system RelE/ParE family toxin n=1 Tax=Acidithiobacillus sp. IBUN Pt1247-S3 TaxID=3166642 RepID=UPI0034E43BF6
MIYSLHPEAESDLREAAEYYRERAGVTIAQAIFDDFGHSMKLLLEHPLLGALWLHGEAA